jgi:cytochrome c peroxidase
MKTCKCLLCAIVTLLVVGSTTGQTLTPKEELGKAVFFDTNLSDPPGQSCATCHAPQVGFTGPSSMVNATTVVYPGAVSTRFGNRKPPSAAYGGESPLFYTEKQGRSLQFVGGMFWDGRATGWQLGDPLAEQARGPFLNPMEQNLASPAAFVRTVLLSTYRTLFEQVYGANVWNDTLAAYDKAAEAIAAYERSSEVNPFTSKFDYYLKGQAQLSKEEQKGMNLFNGKGKCSNCHTSKSRAGKDAPLFTDFTYDNLGIPKNDVFPFNGQPADVGLGGFLATVPRYITYASENNGKHKVPTLRNVDKRPTPDFVKAYGHNGYFKSLKDIVHFYNTRDVGVWPAPEVPQNVNTSELGNLRLKEDEEDAIVAFLKTLSDGHVPVQGKDSPDESPLAFTLMQNSPNPFNPSTTITFDSPGLELVTLKVYDVLGREVATLVNEELPPGQYTRTWNAGAMPSGVYFYRLEAGTFSQIKKMVLLR